MHVKTLAKSELKELNMALRASFGLEPFSKKDAVQQVEGERTYLKVNGRVDYFYHGTVVAPTLKNSSVVAKLKRVVVDMGAVRFLCNGADVMRPGIVRVDDGLEKDEIVAIVDVEHGKALAVGQALFSGEDIMKESKGFMVKNLHYAGDLVWNAH